MINEVCRVNAVSEMHANRIWKDEEKPSAGVAAWCAHPSWSS